MRDTTATVVAAVLGLGRTCQVRVLRAALSPTPSPAGQTVRGQGVRHHHLGSRHHGVHRGRSCWCWPCWWCSASASCSRS